MTITRKLVVAAIVVDDGRILVTQRRPDQSLGGWWEFPGGKVELGECPTAALARELREELGVQAVIGRIWDVLYHRYDTYEVVLLFYPVQLKAGSQPQAREVAEFAWCTVDRLSDYEILPADAPVVSRLQAEGAPAV